MPSPYYPLPVSSLPPPCLLTASSHSLYCLVLPVVDGNGVYALWTWSGIDRAEVISFLQPLPKWTSFVNWSSLTLVVFSYFDFQNTLTVTADHFLAHKAAESFLRTTFWNGKRIWSSPLDINKLFWLKWHDHLQQCAESHSLSRGKTLKLYSTCPISSVQFIRVAPLLPWRPERHSQPRSGGVFRSHTVINIGGWYTLWYYYTPIQGQSLVMVYWLYASINCKAKQCQCMII